MEKNKPEKQRSTIKSIIRYAVIAVVTTVCSVVLATILAIYIIHVNSSREEQAQLRAAAEYFETLAQFSTNINAFDSSMRAINPDYICWISIEDTTIDHPVVRGKDNEKYLETSFTGEHNPLGALFMDYRCTGESIPHIIIYGHNAASGDFFGNLHKFLDWHYMEEHPYITLKINGRTVEYEIFSVRKTDISDPAYFLNFNEPGSFREFAQRCGAPRNAAQILTLSTCVSEGNDDERLIIQGSIRTPQALS